MATKKSKDLDFVTKSKDLATKKSKDQLGSLKACEERLERKNTYKEKLRLRFFFLLNNYIKEEWRKSF